MRELFWLVPASMVLAGILSAVGCVQLDRDGAVPLWLIKSVWLYNGGGTGARTLLGAVASSTIGVAGTVFSITIAALSLAAGQMGPRLLRNFTHDRGNQFTLGAFLGTFSFALMVLRTVRTHDEGEFIPHLALSVSILLAFCCVGTLVYFVGHMAGRINVDTVIELVSQDVRNATRRIAIRAPGPLPPSSTVWRDAGTVTDARAGYLQQVNGEGLADWARNHNTAIRLLVRPGDYVFPGAPVALVAPPVKGAAAEISDALSLGGQRISDDDLEYSVRQLVEVAVRALSPGINDPHTAMSVLDRLGAALCALVGLYLPSGVFLRDDRPTLVMPNIDYDGLLDAMFHLIRQNTNGSSAVLIRMLEVLTAVVSCETVPERISGLTRHADLVIGDAERDVTTPADLADVKSRHTKFLALTHHEPRRDAM